MEQTKLQKFTEAARGWWQGRSAKQQKRAKVLAAFGLLIVTAVLLNTCSGA